MSSHYNWLVRRGPYIGAALGLLGIVVLISAGIVFRNVGIRVGGLQTFSQLIGIWIAFIVAGGLAYERRHIEIDYFTEKLPTRVQYYHSLVVYAMNLLVCLTLAVGGLIAMQRFWTGSAPNAPIPIPVYYLGIVTGAAILGLVYGQQLLEALGVERATVDIEATDEQRDDEDIDSLGEHP